MTYSILFQFQDLNTGTKKLPEKKLPFCGISKVPAHRQNQEVEGSHTSEVFYILTALNKLFPNLPSDFVWSLTVSLSWNTLAFPSEHKGSTSSTFKPLTFSLHFCLLDPLCSAES